MQSNNTDNNNNKKRKPPKRQRILSRKRKGKGHRRQKLPPGGGQEQEQDPLRLTPAPLEEPLADKEDVVELDRDSRAVARFLQEEDHDTCASLGDIFEEPHRQQRLAVAHCFVKKYNAEPESDSCPWEGKRGLISKIRQDLGISRNTNICYILKDVLECIHSGKKYDGRIQKQQGDT